MSAQSKQQSAMMRSLAVLGLCTLLLAVFILPLHRHDAGQPDTCSICHAAERAGAVSVIHQAADPLVLRTPLLIAPRLICDIGDAPIRKHRGRAPPIFLFAA